MLKQAKRFIFILLTLVVIPTASFAVDYNLATVKGESKAYGYVLGQEYTLTRISKEYPELSGEVMLARARFSSTFPDIKTKLETQLKNVMGEKQFQEASATMRKTLHENLSGQKITRQIAVNFIEQVNNRAKGEIESPVLEFLLGVQYMTNPAREVTDGYRQSYKTNGTGKSQGIKLNLKLPRSWAETEGERPHIVKKWESLNGTGTESIMLIIKDMEGYTPTKKEMELFVSSSEVKDTVPDGGTYIASGNYTIEGQPGYWVQFDTSMERVGLKTYQNILMYHLFYRGKAIAIMCNSAGKETEKPRVKETFKRIKPLCQQVFNSLILTQAY